MPILLVGVNHTTTPVDLRERLYISKAELAAFLRRLTGLPGVREAVVLSTCNRTEIYADADWSADLVASLATHANIPLDELRPHLFIHEGQSAVRHLFLVSCGLDSLVIGETQIMGQIRDALSAADESGATGRVLSGLLQQAVATGKRARTETTISEGAFSVGRAAAELVRSLFTDLADSPVLVLGAGKMSELTARHLASNGVRSIFVANRTYEHAQELAERLGGKAIHYLELEQALVDIDILISSTSAPHHVLSAGDIANAMSRRQGRPLCLIDIAVPRDIDPAAGELPDVHLYNIDALQAVTAADRGKRLEEVPKVEAIVEQEVDRWCERQAGLDAAPFISALRDAFERVRRTELGRAANVLATLTPEQRMAVDVMTASMMNKILHTPTVRIKEAIARNEEHLPLNMLCELFALPSLLHEEERP